MKKYQILQGKISFLGCGDYTIMGEYDTLKEAKTAFNYLKDDTSGWNLYHNEVLETLIIKHGSLEDIVDYYTVKGVR